MNQRLDTIYRMIRPGRGIIDVGTDHGYLPERLALDGYPGLIFASDIRKGPLASARRTASRSGVTDRICFLLSDGLDSCPPDAVDTIVIAGMGGDTICGILDRAEWCMDAAYRLILQPMTKAEVLRYWLINNGFFIEEEKLAPDGDTIYQIIGTVFRGSNEKLSDAELFIGKQGLAEHGLYRKLVDRQLRRIENRLLGLRAASETEEDREISELERLYRELLAMRGKDHD